VGNPLKQDIKKGALRFYPYPIKWNYGMIPQTWEDPEHSHPDLEGVTVGHFIVLCITPSVTVACLMLVREGGVMEGEGDCKGRERGL
jgi:inorganic pyrophosphatase